EVDHRGHGPLRADFTERRVVAIAAEEGDEQERSEGDCSPTGEPNHEPSLVKVGGQVDAPGEHAGRHAWTVYTRRARPALVRASPSARRLSFLAAAQSPTR